MGDLDELDRLHAAATGQRLTPSPVAFEVAVTQAWPEVSARLRAAKAVLRALVACDDAINRGDEPPLSRSELAIAARAALGEP